MFITALWVLDQEYKAAKWIWHKGGMSRPGGSFQKKPMTDRELFFATYFGLLPAMAQTGAIGSLGYSTIASVGGRVDDFVRYSRLNEPIGFSLSRGKITPKFAKHSAFKMGAAKLGARFIPYVGWALLATDIYLSGKWLYEKFS